ncbi:MAG: redoxin domain-containing protein, partial [Bacteroidota bacterium]
MRRLLLSIVFLSLALSAAAQKAPDFRVTDIDGNQHHLYGILADSNYVLIDFFYVDCSYCQYYAPHVNQSYHDFGCNNHDVFVTGIDYNDDSAAVRQFRQDYNLDYPLVSGLDGGGDSVIAKYNIEAYPTVMIIGPDSTIWKIMNTPTSSNINNMLENMGAEQIPCNTSVKDNRDEAGFSAWPNPVDKKMNINWKESRSAKLSIYNLNGQKLRELSLEPNQTVTLNLANLNSG